MLFTTHGNKILKSMMVQAAWAASRTKHTYLSDKYRRLLVRRGTKRALVALARKLLIISYYVIKNKKSYFELGYDYLDSMNKKNKVDFYKKKIKDLGYDVSVNSSVA